MRLYFYILINEKCLIYFITEKGGPTSFMNSLILKINLMIITSMILNLFRNIKHKFSPVVDIKNHNNTN